MKRRNELMTFGFPVTALQKQLTDLFEDFFPSFPQTFSGNWPQVNMSIADDRVEVMAELPGVVDTDLELRLEKGILSIRGEKKSENREAKGSYLRVERSTGSFHRSIQMPCEVDEENVVANFQDGILRVSLPRLAPQSNSRKITIQGS